MEPQTAPSTSASKQCEVKKEAALIKLFAGLSVAEVSKEIGVCKKVVSRWNEELQDAKYLGPADEMPVGAEIEKAAQEFHDVFDKISAAMMETINKCKEARAKQMQQ